jgi:hypothetical protein
MEAHRAQPDSGVGEDPAGAALRVDIVHENLDALAGSKLTNDLGVHKNDGGQLTRPISLVMRPRDPGGGVRLPLGGHTVAESGGAFSICDL